MHCQQCNERLSLKSKFCAECGAPVPATIPDSTSVSESASFATEAKEYANDIVAEGKVVAKDALEATKTGMKTDVGKSVATCAAIGAVVAVPIPFVGPVLGAAVGAGIGLLRKI